MVNKSIDHENDVTCSIMNGIFQKTREIVFTSETRIWQVVKREHVGQKIPHLLCLQVEYCGVLSCHIHNQKSDAVKCPNFAVKPVA